jgi:hypothetical protein
VSGTSGWARTRRARRVRADANYSKFPTAAIVFFSLLFLSTTHSQSALFELHEYLALEEATSTRIRLSYTNTYVSLTPGLTLSWKTHRINIEEINPRAGISFTLLLPDRPSAHEAKYLKRPSLLEIFPTMMMYPAAPEAATRLLTFVNASPTPFHAIHNAAIRLEKAGFRKVRSASSCFAIVLMSDANNETGSRDGRLGEEPEPGRQILLYEVRTA